MQKERERVDGKTRLGNEYSQIKKRERNTQAGTEEKRKREKECGFLPIREIEI